MASITHGQKKTIKFKWVRANGEIIFPLMEYDFVATFDVLVNDKLVKDTLEEWCIEKPNGEILTYGRERLDYSQGADGIWLCPMSSGIVEHIELHWKAYIRLQDVSTLQSDLETSERKQLKIKEALEKYQLGRPHA